MFDDYGFWALHDLVAEGGLQPELVPGGKPKTYLVLGEACDPLGVRNPGHGSEAHPGGAADDIEQWSDCLHSRNVRDIPLEIGTEFIHGFF